MTDEELYDQNAEKFGYYDYIVSKAIEQLINLTPTTNTITLTNFDVKDKGDLFLLEILKICGFWGKQGYIDAKSINPITYHFKKYLFNEIERVVDIDDAGALDTEIMLAELRLKEDLDDDTIFHEIYDEYYKPASWKLRTKIKIDKFFSSIKGKIKNTFSKTKEKLNKDEEML